MKKIIKEHKILSLLVLVSVLIISFYFIREFIGSKEIYTESYLDGEEYIMNPKTYDVNEYSPVQITNEQIANIYLNDYKKYLFNNINYAYELLDEQYRTLKFGSIENFINYINTLGYRNIVMDKYSVRGNPSIITIYDSDGKIIIFKSLSVMEYKVYFDDYTVEI